MHTRIVILIVLCPLYKSFSCKLAPCHSGITRPLVTDEDDGFQLGKVDAITVNKGAARCCKCAQRTAAWGVSGES
jgi:hypothetical protein